MAVEVRRIIMEQYEFQAVLNIHSQSGDSSLAKGFVASFNITENSPLEIGVSIRKKDGVQSYVPMGENDILSALINSCIKTKISVSQKYNKTVKFLDSKIAFDMSLNNPSFVANN